MRFGTAFAAFALSVATLQSACAAGSSDRQFVEIHSSQGWSDIYDLSTARMILPGRFAVTKTVVGDPDRIRLELSIFEILSPYCERPYGKYSAPETLLSLVNRDIA